LANTNSDTIIFSISFSLFGGLVQPGDARILIPAPGAVLGQFYSAARSYD